MIDLRPTPPPIPYAKICLSFLSVIIVAFAMAHWVGNDMYRRDKAPATQGSVDPAVSGQDDLKSLDR